MISSSRVSSPTMQSTSGDCPLILKLLATFDRLDPEKLDQLWDAQSDESISFEESVIRSGLADETQIAQAYANHYLLPLFDPPLDQPAPVDRTMAQRLPAQLCRDHLIAPLSDDGHTLEVAIFSPDALRLAAELKLLTDRKMRALFAPLSVIERLLGVLYDDEDWNAPLRPSERQKVGKPHYEATEFESPDFEPVDFEPADVVPVDLEPFEDASSEASSGEPVMQYVQTMFEQALQAGASAIHIEAHEGSCRIRIRIGVTLSELTPPPLGLLPAVIARLKGLAKLDVNEQRIPQDGAMVLRMGERRVNLLVNTCPTVDSEKLVMRVMEEDELPCDLFTLGLDQRQYKDLTESIRLPHGLILVSGPRCSGKSTTLYSCLKHLNDSETNICTVEDPVECRLSGVNQVQTRAQLGLTFAGSLRSLLRQDPDVIMVGEMRDVETAELCLSAALTGPLVFSTLDAPDTLSAIRHLQQMDATPNLIANTLQLLVAQRLMRKLCVECCEPYRLQPEGYARHGIPPGTTLLRAVGCRQCQGTGYRGRLAIFEVVRLNATLRGLIQVGAPVEQMRQAVIADGSCLLAQSAIRNVIAGNTTLEEAQRIAAQLH